MRFMLTTASKCMLFTSLAPMHLILHYRDRSASWYGIGEGSWCSTGMARMPFTTFDSQMPLQVREQADLGTRWLTCKEQFQPLMCLAPAVQLSRTTSSTAPGTLCNTIIST